MEDYRSPLLTRKYLDEIQRIVTRRWVIMEICGGQTHAIMQYGLEQFASSKN